MFKALLLVSILLPASFAVAACSSDSASSSSATNTPAATSPAATSTSAAAGGSAEPVTIVAKNLTFDKKEIDATANVPTTITLDNQDTSVPHNFSVYDSKSASQKILVGDIDTGPAKKDYTVPALAAGTYFFRCDVHPDTMSGNFIVK